MKHYAQSSAFTASILRFIDAQTLTAWMTYYANVFSFVMKNARALPLLATFTFYITPIYILRLTTTFPRPNKRPATVRNTPT